MSNTNTIAITGRLNVGEFVSFDGSPNALYKVSLAHNQYDKKAEDNNVVTWFELQIWGKRGETFEKLCQKGDLVMISGTLKIREWQGQKGKGIKNYIDVADFENLSPKERSNGNGGGNRNNYNDSDGYDTSSSSRNQSNNAGGGNPDDVPF